MVPECQPRATRAEKFPGTRLIRPPKCVGNSGGVIREEARGPASDSRILLLGLRPPRLEDPNGLHRTGNSIGKARGAAPKADFALRPGPGASRKVSPLQHGDARSESGPLGSISS